MSAMRCSGDPPLSQPCPGDSYNSCRARVFWPGLPLLPSSFLHSFSSLASCRFLVLAFLAFSSAPPCPPCFPNLHQSRLVLTVPIAKREPLASTQSFSSRVRDSFFFPIPFHLNTSYAQKMQLKTLVLAALSSLASGKSPGPGDGSS